MFDFNETLPKRCLSLKTNNAASTFVMIDRRNVDFNKNEVDKMAKWTVNNEIYYVSFYVMRRETVYVPGCNTPAEIEYICGSEICFIAFGIPQSHTNIFLSSEVEINLSPFSINVRLLMDPKCSSYTSVGLFVRLSLTSKLKIFL